MIKVLAVLAMLAVAYYTPPAMAAGSCIPTGIVVAQIDNPMAAVFETLVGGDARDFRQAALAHGINAVDFDEVIVFYIPEKADVPFYIILSLNGCVTSHGVLDRAIYEELRQGRPS
jgi:hypothetical protein